MARTYGAIYLRIWRDPDWRTLHYAEQYLYMALVSQAKLNRAGLLEYSPRRWAEAAVGMSPADVEVVVKNLEQRKYVVLDETTNELLVRTYVRNGDAWKMPKVMAAVVSAAGEIDSPKLRHALFLELDRIPVDELSDAPAANGGASIRAKIEKCIDELRAILGGNGPDDATRATDGAPYEQAEESPIDVPAEPYGKGIDTPPIVSGTSVRAQAVPVPVPVPVPTPEPKPAVASCAESAGSFVPDFADADKPRGTETAKAPAAKKSRSRRKGAVDPESEARDKLAREVVEWWWERLDKKPAGRSAWFAAVATVNALLKVGWPAKDIANAARTIGSPLTIARMEIQLNLDTPAGVPQQRLGGNVLPFQRPGSNDVHLAAAMERAQARDAAQSADPTRRTSPWKAITA